MSRLTSLFRVPDAVRPFLRYDHRPVLTLACLDVSTWLLPEPAVLSTTMFKTLRHPDNMAVLDDTLIVVGEHNRVVIHRLPDFAFIDFGLDIEGRIRDLETMDNQLLVLPSGRFIYHGDQPIELKGDWRATRGICPTPHGFVVCSNAPADQPVDWRDRAPGILQFYENGICTHTVQTYYAWYSITWVGQGDIAFAATRLLNGVCEVTLLSVDGKIYDVLKHDIPTGELTGLSIVYDPKWNEYIVSGGKRIIAFTPYGSRELYEYKSSHYLHSLVLHGRNLLVCVRIKHSILQLELN